MNEWLNNYIEGYKKSLEAIPVDSIGNLILEFARVNKDNRQIFVFGNGGSASNASHFVTDMAKGASDKMQNRFKCYSLNEHMGLITAISNDYSYKDIFKKQLENLASAGDLLLTLSVSGSSPNLVEAVKWANENGLHTIALVGGNEGQLAELAKELIVVDSTHYGHVEDIHMLICHMIAYAFMENPDIVDSL
ncbi:SIS domain-containing protein [Bacteroidota bacterium]